MFTVASHPDRNSFPSQNFVENRARLDIWILQRAGALTPGATTTIEVNGEPVGCLRAEPGSRILVELAGQKRVLGLVQDTPMPDVPRLWFECPACRKRCRHVYLPELACRGCLQLEHAVRHRFRDAAACRLARVARLRRWLGVDPRPFGELPPPKRRRGRYWRLAAQIAAEEVQLLASMRRFGEAAERERQWLLDQNPRASMRTVSSTRRSPGSA